MNFVKFNDNIYELISITMDDVTIKINSDIDICKYDIVDIYLISDKPQVFINCKLKLYSSNKLIIFAYDTILYSKYELTEKDNKIIESLKFINKFNL